MSDIPLVSICIPAYNHERYIGECLEALLDQDYPNMELIVINDGSKDNTWEIINTYKERCDQFFKRVIFKTQENQGTCKTLNSLLQEAAGEYIALCASDDKFLPHAIQAEAEFLTANPKSGLVFGTNLIMDSDSTICYWDKQQNNVYNKEQATYTSFTDFITKCTSISPTSELFGTYQGILKSNHIGNGWMFRRALLNVIPPFTPEAPLEDHWFMMQVSKHAQISFIPNETFCYRWHATNTIKQHEKMRIIAKQTYLWEKKYVSTLPCKKFAHIFRKHLFQERMSRIYKKKITRKGYLLIRVLGITVFRKRLTSEEIAKLTGEH